MSFVLHPYGLRCVSCQEKQINEKGLNHVVLMHKFNVIQMWNHLKPKILHQMRDFFIIDKLLCNYSPYRSWKWTHYNNDL